MVPVDSLQQSGHDLSNGHDPDDVGRRIEWTYFRWDQIQDGGWPAVSWAPRVRVHELLF